MRRGVRLRTHIHDIVMRWAEFFVCRCQRTKEIHFMFGKFINNGEFPNGGQLTKQCHMFFMEEAWP